MANSFGVKLIGFKELDNFLEEMAQKQGNKILRKALRPSSERIVNLIRPKVPIRSGRLVHAIEVKAKTRKGVVAFHIMGEYYGRFVEFGHVTRKVIGREEYISRRGQRRTKDILKKTGFVEAKPFIRPTINSNEPALLGEIISAMNKEIMRIWNRHLGKLKKQGNL